MPGLPSVITSLYFDFVILPQCEIGHLKAFQLALGGSISSIRISGFETSLLSKSSKSAADGSGGLINSLQKNLFRSLFGSGEEEHRQICFGGQEAFPYQCVSVPDNLQLINTHPPKALVSLPMLEMSEEGVNGGRKQ